MRLIVISCPYIERKEYIKAAGTLIYRIFCGSVKNVFRGFFLALTILVHRSERKSLRIDLSSYGVTGFTLTSS